MYTRNETASTRDLGAACDRLEDALQALRRAGPDDIPAIAGEMHRELAPLVRRDRRTWRDPHLAEFAAYHLEPAPGEAVQARELYRVYEGWCRANDLEAYSETAFGLGLPALGFHRRQSRVHAYLDVRAVAPPRAARHRAG
jgi:hypothetical protein